MSTKGDGIKVMGKGDGEGIFREDNLEKNKVKSEKSVNTRPVSKRESDSLKKDCYTKAAKQIESDRRVDRVLINNVKQQRKKEEKASGGKRDIIEVSYPAFTFHETSAFETSLFDIKSTSSDFAGVNLDKTEVTESKRERIQKNNNNRNLHIGDIVLKPDIEKMQQSIENSSLYIGDSSPRREVEQQEENITNNNLYREDISADRKIILNELNRDEEASNAKSEMYKEKETKNEAEQHIKKDNNIFSIGKRMMQRFIKWSVDSYEMTKYDYEMTSSNNYLHNLSKKITK